MTSYRQETEPSEPKAIALEPTAKLRWKNCVITKNVVGVLHELSYTTSEMVAILQQLWVDKYTGYSEWRDIPTE